MRPDRRKRNRGRNAERSDDSGVQEKKNDGKNDSNSEDAQKTKPEETPEKTDQDKVATNESSVTKEQSENQPAPALRRETDALKETKKFSKRQIFSNWEKYDEPIVHEEEESQNDFFSLIQRNFSGDEHFKFKCERQWESESFNMNQDLFTLNLEHLSAGLECIPYYKRLNLPKYFFSENELQRMHKVAKNQEKIYETILKGEFNKKAETIIALLNLKENTDAQLVDETKASSVNQNQEVAFTDRGEFMMKDSNLDSSEGFWNGNKMNENFNDENQFNEKKANENRLDERKADMNQLEQRKAKMNKSDEKKEDRNQLDQRKVNKNKSDEKKVDMNRLGERKEDGNQLDQRRKVNKNKLDEKVDMNRLDERKVDMNQLDERKIDEIKFYEEKVNESVLSETKENENHADKSKVNKNELEEIKVNVNEVQTTEVSKNNNRGREWVTDQMKANDDNVLIESNRQSEAQALPARAKTVRRDVEKEKSIESSACVESLSKESVVKKDEPPQVPEVKAPLKAKGGKSKNASKVKSMGKEEEVLDSLLSLKEPAISPIDMSKNKVEEEENEADNLVTDVTSIVIHEKKENLEEWLDSMLDD